MKLGFYCIFFVRRTPPSAFILVWTYRLSVWDLSLGNLQDNALVEIEFYIVIKIFAIPLAFWSVFHRYDWAELLGDFLISKRVRFISKNIIWIRKWAFFVLMVFGKSFKQNKRYFSYPCLLRREVFLGRYLNLTINATEYGSQIEDEGKKIKQ